MAHYKSGNPHKKTLKSAVAKKKKKKKAAAKKAKGYGAMNMNARKQMEQLEKEGY